MGGSTSSAQTWQTYSAANTAATPQQTFTSRMLHEDLDPAKLKGPRESCDSAANPASTAISIYLDQTGSMAEIPQYMMSPDGMPVIFKGIYDKKPVTDPHVLFGAIGDINMHEPASLQVTQFEADIKLVDQLKKVWLVGQGGGNGSESYPLAWHFNAMHTAIDCFTKRGRKGFLWTIGDDAPPPMGLTKENLQAVYGPGEYSDLSLQQLLDMVSRQWHVFHIHVRHGRDQAYYGSDHIEQAWKAVLGERCLITEDYTALSETIVSTMQLVAGVDKATVVAGLSAGKALVVGNTIRDLSPAIVDPQALVTATRGKPGQVVTF
jgi:hypothetical protein